MKRGSLILIAIIALIALWAWKGYNGLVTTDESVKKAWNNVQTEYQTRNDLVGNLVNTVKGAAKFEQETLTKVIEARAKATSVNVDANNLTPENVAKFQEAQSQLSGALSRLIVTVEQYPQLKANQNFLELQSKLSSIENNINGARRTFNDEVQSYNTQVRAFPMNILGNMFGFKAKEGFKADPGAEKAPKVEF